MHKSIKVGIIGATGYTGIELVRLLSAHPYVEITCVTSESYAGNTIGDVYPHLRSISIPLQKINIHMIKQQCDLVFIALPHRHAIQITEKLIDTNIKIIDLGADFRLKNPESYSSFYGETPASQDLLDSALYGLPEINVLANYQNSSIIANPGCYPTAAILGAAPLLINDLISLKHIILDGKSGVSGAGRGLAVGTHYCEVSENFKAYKIAGTHRHTPEIEEVFTKLSGNPVAVNFTPHLVPMVRGLFMTGYYKAKGNTSEEQIREAYEAFYKDSPFVRVLAKDQLPETAHVKGSNFADIGVNYNERTQTIIITSAIDNLLKGASGQAVQNMNRSYGFDEAEGLSALAVYP